MSNPGMQVLYVRTFGDAELRPVDAVPPHDITDLVGGWPEGAVLTSDSALYWDTEAHVIRRPVNAVATALMRDVGSENPGRVLLGDVVFLGRWSDATETDVPQWLVDRVAALVTAHQA